MGERINTLFLALGLETRCMGGPDSGRAVPPAALTWLLLLGWDTALLCLKTRMAKESWKRLKGAVLNCSCVLLGTLRGTNSQNPVQ